MQLPDGLHWNILELFRQSLKGIGLAGRTHRVQGIAVDTWGVDYGLLDEDHRLLGLPFHYRDRRTEGLVDRAADRLAAADAYETTGIRPMQINTVYQLLAEEGSPALEAAHRLALIPDLLTYWLCGVMANERTVASTTGLLDARSGSWAYGLIDCLGLPERIFSEIVDPGTVARTPAGRSCDRPSSPRRHTRDRHSGSRHGRGLRRGALDQRVAGGGLVVGDLVSAGP